VNLTSNEMNQKKHSITEMSDFFTSFTLLVPHAHSALSFNSIFPSSHLLYHNSKNQLNTKTSTGKLGTNMFLHKSKVPTWPF